MLTLDSHAMVCYCVQESLTSTGDKIANVCVLKSCEELEIKCCDWPMSIIEQSVWFGVPHLHRIGTK